MTPAEDNNPLRPRFAWLGAAVALAVSLKAIGEFYPLSHFPMYSGFGEHAHVLHVETGDGRLVPLIDVFGRRESRCKKMWNSQVSRLANAGGRDSSAATDEELSAAGEWLLEQLVAERRYGELEAFAAESLRLVLHRIELAEGSGDRLIVMTRPIAQLDLTDAVESPRP